ncbi:Gfo/Idh/MocA family protein [Lacibacterium aquatile]|uniref:Gfo/Idh/MocA family protein n=1 Tax=Lacibacterium aquatile TaxID=1168082 RepID=A0ABW5DWJ6_9PROT
MGRIWNVAIVGCGIGRTHIFEGYARHPDKFRVLALCDLNPERLAAVADEFNVPRRTTSFQDLLEMADVDIIDVCTPPGLHFEQTMAALKAGKHAVCEKPLVGSLAEVDTLEAAEKTYGRRILPIFQYRYGNGVQKAKRIIDAGIAGKPYLGTVETSWHRTQVYYDVPWRGKWATELGGVLVTHSIHNHDMLMYLMGDVDQIFARTATRVNKIEVEDCVSASLRMKNGALVSLSATLGSVRQISRLRLCFENVTFESGLEPYRPGDDPWMIQAVNAEIQERIDDALKGWRHVPTRFEGLMAEYGPGLETGNLPVTLADARRSLELVTAIYTSSAEERAIDLPLKSDAVRYGSWRPQQLAG